MKTKLLIVFFFGILSLSAQSVIDFNHYSSLQCAGAMPEDFKKELSVLVNEAGNRVNDKSRKEIKEEIEFAELSNHQLNNILYSGKVLYGDAMTVYVNKVADLVLKDEPELRKKLRFYVLKNTDLNAYSTQRGIVFVSIGLLAQIETEAQLAFIICHEIVHFRNNHNLETFKRNREIFENRRDPNMYNRMSHVMNYSKENELEADKEGLRLFLKTGYSTSELNNLFDVMLYSYLPFDEIVFDTLYFNGYGYQLPRKYFPLKVSEINPEENINDSLSTHPNIKKRRGAIQRMLTNESRNSGKSFQISEQEFKLVQRAARCELAIVYLQEAELEEALYSSYLMEKLYGKTLFSDQIICGALYMLSKQKNHGQLKERRVARVKKKYGNDDRNNAFWESVEGESQAIYYFTFIIPALDLNILAARKQFEAYNLYHDDFFRVRFKSLIEELVNKFGYSKASFFSELLASDEDQLQIDSTIQEENSAAGGSKISKIKNKTGRTEKKSEEDPQKKEPYYKFAFVGYYYDSLLDKSFEYYTDQFEIRRKAELSVNYIRYREAKKRLIEMNGEALGVDTFIMINPHYASYLIQTFYSGSTFYSYRVRNSAISPLQEIKIEQELVSEIRSLAVKQGIVLDVVGYNRQGDITTDQFNDYQQLMNWYSERVSVGNMDAHMYGEQSVKKFADKYGYLGFLYVSNIHKTLEVVFLFYDLENGNLLLNYENEKKTGKPNGSSARAMLQDILKQIHQRPTKDNRLKQKYNIKE